MIEDGSPRSLFPFAPRMTMFRPAVPSHRLASVCAAAAVAAGVAIVGWPGVHGFWGRDDFMQLAFARLVGSPWPLFVHDHYAPAPGVVFRPLGFASFWLWQAVFGTDYRAHAIADLALHAGVALALLRVLLRARVPRTLALACSLLFALHPAVIGCALWWSARFDLLATLFILLALDAAFAYRDRPRSFVLAGALCAAMAAMLSKEIGLAVMLPLSLLWLRWARIEPARRAIAWRAVALAWLCALVWFGWRWRVLGTPASELTGTMPLTQALMLGVLDWTRQAGGYLSYWVRLDGAQRLALVASGVALAAAVAGGLRRRPRTDARRHLDLALCGLCLVALPALLQAPVAALNAAHLDRGMSAVEAAMQSRLYYLGIAGVAMLLAALLAPVWTAASPRARLAFAAPLALAAGVFALVSHDDARAFARRSVAISAVARAAVAEVAALDLTATHCHVVFLGVEPAPEWSFYVSMDSIVKALSPDLGHVEHCWFDADYATYFHLLAAPADAADALPYEPLRVNGIRLPWRRIGALEVAYVRPPEPVAGRDLAGVRFLAWRDGRFEDVSDAVASGQRPVQLR